MKLSPLPTQWSNIRKKCQGICSLARTNQNLCGESFVFFQRVHQSLTTEVNTILQKFCTDNTILNEPLSPIPRRLIQYLGQGHLTSVTKYCLLIYVAKWLPCVLEILPRAILTAPLTNLLNCWLCFPTYFKSMLIFQKHTPLWRHQLLSVLTLLLFPYISGLPCHRTRHQPLTCTPKSCGTYL